MQPCWSLFHVHMLRVVVRGRMGRQIKSKITLISTVWGGPNPPGLAGPEDRPRLFFRALNICGVSSVQDL